MLHNMLRAAAGRDRIPTDGLVAWYTMDNISGSTLVDEAGNYDGTITGATQVAGNLGQALQFASGDKVTLSTPIIPSTDPWSISLWIKPSTINDVHAFFAQYYDTQSLRFAVYSTGDGKVVCQIGGSSIVSPAALAVGNYYHVVVKRNSSNTASIYINGSLSASGSLTSSVDQQATLIGRAEQGGTIFQYLGDIDQLRVYNREVTADEIAQLYNEGA